MELEWFKFWHKVSIEILSQLPDVPDLQPPEGFTEGLQQIFGLLGWIAPYDLYQPLFAFILLLIAFRISYAIYIRFFHKR